MMTTPTALLTGLIQNLALLLSLAFAYSLLWPRLRRSRPVTYALLTGGLFGCMGILGMLARIEVEPGVVIDGRVIVVALAGVFNGPWAGVVAGALVGAYRLWLGGVGAVAGIGAIATGAAIGAWVHWRWGTRVREFGAKHFVLLGTALGAAGLLWTLAVPDAGLAWRLLRAMAVPVALAYPLGALLLGLLLSYLAGERHRLALTRLSLDHSGEAVFWIDRDGRIADVNPAALALCGYSRAELGGMRLWQLSDTVSAGGWPELWETIRARGTVGSESALRARDGRLVPVEASTAFVEFGGEAYACSFLRDISGRKRAEETARALAETGRVLAESLDMDLTARRVADTLCRLLETQNAAVYRLVEGSGDLALIAMAGPDGEVLGSGWSLPRGTGVAGLAVQGRAPVQTPNLLADPGVVLAPETRRRIERAAYRSGLAVPLMVKGRVVGALGVGDREGRIFDRLEVELVQAFADEAALALDQARLFAEAERRRRAAEELARVARTLTETLYVRDVAERIVESARALFGANLSALRVLQPDGSLLTLAMAGPAARLFEAGHAVGAGEGVPGCAVAEGRAVWVPDVLDAPGLVHGDLHGRVVESGTRAALAVPLLAKGKIVGTLSIGDRVAREFSDAEVSLLQSFAVQAALALENARLYEETERRRRAAETLAEVGQAISRSLDRGQVAQRIVDGVQALLGAQHAALYRVEPGSQDLLMLSLSGDAGPAIGPGFVLPRGAGVAGLAARERRPVVTPDLLADPRLTFTPEVRARIAEGPYRAVAAVPLLVQDRLVGVFSCGDREGRAFSAADVELLLGFAQQAALALDNARLYEEAERGKREAEMLAELARDINASLDLDAVLRRVARGVRELCGADNSAVALAEPDSECVTLRYWAGVRDPRFRGQRVEPGRGLGGQVLLTGRPLRTGDYLADPRISHDYLDIVREEGAVAVLAVPIRGAGRPKGLLYAANRSPRPFTDRDEAALVRLAEHTAVAIQNARLFAERQRAAEALRRHAERLEVLHELDWAILSDEPPETIALTALRGIARLVPCQHGRVAVLAPDADRPTELASYARGRAPSGLGPSEWEPAVRHLDALRRAASHVVEDVAVPGGSGSSPGASDGGGGRCYLTVPMLFSGELIGAVSMAAERPGAFGPEQAEVAREVADLLAVAIQQARMRAELRAGRERLEHLSRRLVQTQEAERCRIARELHDEVGQVLTGLKLRVETAARLVDGAVRGHLDAAQALVGDLLARVRRLALDLRPAMLDDLGLPAALGWHLGRYEADTGVRVRFQHSGVEGRRLPPEVATAAYRIVQEALTNVARHAGVGEAAVRLWVDHGALWVQVHDAGAGFEPGAVEAGGGSTGLAGMRERARSLGGDLTIESQPGAGTRVTAELRLGDRLSGATPGR